MPVNGWQALIPNMVQLPPVSAAGYSLAGTGLGTPSARTCYLVFLRGILDIYSLVGTPFFVGTYTVIGKVKQLLHIRSKVRYRCSAIGFGTTLSEGSISLV
jgi:hypothetical protein